MAGFLSRRDAQAGYTAAGGANFDSDYKSEKQKLRESGLRGRKLRQTARRNVMGNAISKSAGLENTLDQNIDQIGNETDTYINNDIHRAIMQGQQEQRDFLDQLNEESEALKGLVKPIQIKSTHTPTGEPVKVMSTATDATIETPAPGQVAQIQNSIAAGQEEPNYNSMSKRDAWALARKLKGKDGILEWNGQKIGLKYAEEVAAEKAAAAKANANNASQKPNAGTNTESSTIVETAPQMASPSVSQVDSTKNAPPSNQTKPATIVTTQNSSATPKAAAIVPASQNKDISKPWNKTYQLGNRTLTHDQMEDYLFNGKLDDPNLYHGAPTMSMIPEEYAKNTDTSQFTYGKPISTSELYTDRASNVTPRQQYTQQDLNNEIRQIDSQTWYNQNHRRQAINAAYAKYNASRK